MCAVAARELGYAELSSLSVEDRIRVEDEAKLYVEQWEETVEMRTNFTIRPVTPMRHLLAEYHDICERILDEHEIVAGLWPTGKEPRSADAQRPFRLRHLRNSREGVGFGRRVLIEEVAPGTQPYLPSSAIYREAGWPL